MKKVFVTFALIAAFVGVAPVAANAATAAPVPALAATPSVQPQQALGSILDGLVSSLDDILNGLNAGLTSG